MLSISLIARLHISNEERQVILNICACIDAKLNDLDYEVTSIINAQNNIRDLRYTDETLNDKCRRYFDADIKCKKREARKISYVSIYAKRYGANRSRNVKQCMLLHNSWTKRRHTSTASHSSMQHIATLSINFVRNTSDSRNT